MSLRQIIFLCLCTLLLNGCIRQTLTETPSFSGTVVDSNTGKPISGVSINDQFVTAADGQFAFRAIDKKVWALPIPGTGAVVVRELTFKKTEYRPTTCRVENFALFAESNRATIPLLRIEESETSPEPPVFSNIDHEKTVFSQISCRIFIGNRVHYNNSSYIIGEIYRAEEEPELTLLALWPIFPNDGEVVLDVPYFDVTLTTGTEK